MKSFNEWMSEIDGNTNQKNPTRSPWLLGLTSLLPRGPGFFAIVIVKSETIVNVARIGTDSFQGGTANEWRPLKSPYDFDDKNWYIVPQNISRMSEFEKMISDRIASRIKKRDPVAFSYGGGGVYSPTRYACNEAGVPFEKVYESKEEAQKDANKLNKVAEDLDGFNSPQLIRYAVVEL